MMNGKMPTRVKREISEARGVKSMSESEIYKLREEVKRLMWEHYSEHSEIYSDQIRYFREEIIIKLMKGQRIEYVFGNYAAEEYLLVS